MTRNPELAPRMCTDVHGEARVDEERQELVLQGWKPSHDLEAECAALELPGHGVGIPEGEAVIRIPARMVHMIREAGDALDRT